MRSIREGWNKGLRTARKRVRFVGVETYEAAGGTILRDLFDDEDSGYFQQPALLEQLVMEKLKACADEVVTDGWKWVAANVDYPWGHICLLLRCAKI